MRDKLSDKLSERRGEVKKYTIENEEQGGERE